MEQGAADAPAGCPPQTFFTLTCSPLTAGAHLVHCFLHLGKINTSQNDKSWACSSMWKREYVRVLIREIKLSLYYLNEVGMAPMLTQLLVKLDTTSKSTSNPIPLLLNKFSSSIKNGEMSIPTSRILLSNKKRHTDGTTWKDFNNSRLQEWN